MSFAYYNDQTSNKINKSLMIKNMDMKTTTSSSPTLGLSKKSTLIDSTPKDATMFHTAHAFLPSPPPILPESKNQGADPITAPTVHYPTSSLNADIQTDSPQPRTKILITDGAIDEELDEPLEFTPSVPSSVSAPPHPQPLIKRFGPKMLLTMLLETWNDEFPWITIPRMSWESTQTL
jgi:hypothetical protein